MRAFKIVFLALVLLHGCTSKEDGATGAVDAAASSTGNFFGDNQTTDSNFNVDSELDPVTLQLGVSWPPVEGAVSYSIIVTSDESGETVVHQIDVGSDVLTHTFDVDGLTPYYVFVGATLADGGVVIPPTQGQQATPDAGQAPRLSYSGSTGTMGTVGATARLFFLDLEE